MQTLLTFVMCGLAGVILILTIAIIAAIVNKKSSKKKVEGGVFSPLPIKETKSYSSRTHWFKTRFVLVVTSIICLGIWAWKSFKGQDWSWIAIPAIDWKNPWAIGVGVAILLLFIIYMTRKSAAVMTTIVSLSAAIMFIVIACVVFDGPIAQNARQRQKEDRDLLSSISQPPQIVVTVRPDEPVRVDWPNDRYWNYQTFSSPRPTRIWYWRQKNMPTEDQRPCGVIERFGKDPEGIPGSWDPLWVISEDEIAFELIITFSHR